MTEPDGCPARWVQDPWDCDCYDCWLERHIQAAADRRADDQINYDQNEKT